MDLDRQAANLTRVIGLGSKPMVLLKGSCVATWAMQSRWLDHGATCLPCLYVSDTSSDRQNMVQQLSLLDFSIRFCLVGGNLVWKNDSHIRL